MTTLLCVPPLHARIEKPKTGYLYLVSVEAGIWLLLYATAGLSASHVSRTIDGSWFLGGLELCSRRWVVRVPGTAEDVI